MVPYLSEAHLEPAPFSGFALEPNFSAVYIRYSLHHREPEPVTGRSVRGTFASVEPFKNALFLAFGYPSSVVFDRKDRAPVGISRSRICSLPPERDHRMSARLSVFIRIIYEILQEPRE